MSGSMVGSIDGRATPAGLPCEAPAAQKGVVAFGICRNLRAALSIRYRAALVAGCARTWITARSPGSNVVIVPRARRRGSVSGVSPIGNHSGSAKASSVMAMPPCSGNRGLWRSDSVLAPGQAASTARSTSPGGIIFGTQSEIASSSASATTSQAR
jgi:hypothetical protein